MSISSNEDAYWPPPRMGLHRTTIDIICLHNLPKRSEQRPRLAGSRGKCHNYHPELSGSHKAPDNLKLSCPGITLSVYPIGGFCAVSRVLPLPEITETEISVSPEDNGMNAAYGGDTIHCCAAEPHATFLRVGVVEAGLEIAYEIAVLGRLHHGYRILRLRNLLGTRIELCYLFVKITFASDPNLWASPRQLRIQSDQHRAISDKLQNENARLNNENTRLNDEHTNLKKGFDLLRQEMHTLLGKSRNEKSRIETNRSFLREDDEDD